MNHSDEKLKPLMTLWPVVLFGCSFMALATVFSTYGVAAEMSHGLVTTSYLIALVVMLFTAYSYGQMAKAYPLSGSAYTYSQKELSPYVGFLVGWAILMDYLFIPMVNYLLFGIFFSAQFPQIPSYVWIIGLIVIVTLINIRGIRLATHVNIVLTAVTVLFIALFIIMSIKYLLNGGGTAAIFTPSTFLGSGGTVHFSYLTAGAALLCFSFLGFDSATTFAEETRQPEKTIPKAVIIITLLGGAIFILCSYFMQNVWPDYHSFANPDSAAKEIIEKVGGSLLNAFFLAIYALGILGSAMASQASAARILFAMGRDGQLPKRFFGKLHYKYKTPYLNILFISVLSLSALFLSLSLVASFINFGAFIAFICVNLSVIAHYFFRLKKRSGKALIAYFLLPLIGALLDGWLLFNLDIHSKILGITWLIVGIIYLLFLTKGFKQRPQMADLFAKDEALALKEEQEEPINL